MEKLVVIDGNFWLFSCYYATAAMGNLMVNKDGVPTNAVYGFANRLESLLKQNPEYIVVAFDAKGNTFRSELLEEYKGTRKPTPDELVCQFSMVREYLEAHHIPYIEKEGYEGDDIIGTISKKASNQGMEVAVYTNDKDMMQLIDSNVKQYKKPQKTNDYEVITVESFKEKYNLEPDQMRDLLGLMGDSADNIPGIPGIGEKTALKLLNQYGTIENLKEHMDELKGKMGEKVRTNIELGLLSKKIATIITDAPVELDLDAWKYEGQEYNDDLAEFYRRYDMNSLLKRMSLSTETKQSKPLEYKIVETLPNIKKNTALIAGVYDTNYHKSACGFDHCSLKKRITMMMERKTPGWKRLYILIAFPLAAGAVFVFAQPKVDAALQTVVVRQAAMCDSSSLNMSVSAADYAGLAPDAVAFDVYVNQRNQLMIGVFDKMDVVKLEGLADAVSKRLVADFSSRYAKNKEVPQIVACITADRNAKMGCVYETKQQISRGYELALRELSAEYSAELLQHSLSNRIVYNPPRSYGNPVAKVADKNKRLEGFGITIFMEGEEKRSLRDFTLQELESEIASLLERVDISKNVISIGLNVPKDVQEGMVYDVKQVLRKLYLLKVDVAH